MKLILTVPLYIPGQWASHPPPCNGHRHIISIPTGITVHVPGLHRADPSIGAFHVPSAYL